MDRLGNMFTSEEVNTQLKELLILKRSGELDSEERLLKSDNEFWRDSITYDCLERYVQHYDTEIKLNTIAVVTESKKSTLKFSPKELEIIILFLRVNFKEKIEYVPYIKKALKRMKDSLNVMRRQFKQEEKMRNHYRKNCNPLEIKQEILDNSSKISNSLESDIKVYCNIFQSLRNMCLCSPDATYYRRKCSLQILLLMRELLDNEFKNIAWEAKQTVVLFNLMLLDTYESNKEMAFSLIKSLDPSLLQLHNEHHVHDIITVAIELGNSIRPIDTITAAYMLKIGTLSPIIQNVLENQVDSIKFNEYVTESAVLKIIRILLNKLKESLTLAKVNIVKTVTKHSLYGYLFCIRSLLQDCNLKNVGREDVWQRTIAEMVSLCFELSRAVSLIVNNSSPEGHLPMDLNLQTINEICGPLCEKQVVTPQMVLLCSWRTIKEVSLLFGLLATKAPICEDNSAVGLLNEEQIIKIGEHLVSLLTETKHRGAFEQAHVGFSQLCSRLWRLNNTNLNQLPKFWLHQILIAITGIKQSSKLCATRRSAGVPFMIQALLSTEPRQHKDTKTTTFDAVMNILLGLTQLESGDLRKKTKELIYSHSVFTEFNNLLISQKDLGNNETTEIKTHALNILRAIFRHSQLGEVVNNYVEDGIIAAFRSYDALTWAERNAATLLFSALIIRIFGVQRTKDHINLAAENKMNYRLFFENYPNLLPFILHELQTFVAMDDTLIKSNVQSILLLLSRLYHSHSSEPNNIQWKITDLIELIIQCAKSAIFETRKLAARALVPLLTEQSVGRVLAKIVAKVISAQDNNLSLNLIHGCMLQIYEILKYFDSKSVQSPTVKWNEFFKNTTWILENLESKNSKSPCFLLAAVFLNICHEIYEVDRRYISENPAMLNTLVSHLLGQELKQGPARELYKLSAMKLIRSVAGETSLIQQCMPFNMYRQNLRCAETQIFAWSTVIDIINETKSSDLSESLLNYAVGEIQDSIEQLHKLSPELQDAMFDFLYNSILFLSHTELSHFTRRKNICKFVLREVRLDSNKIRYCERDCYLRLLGKSYVVLVSLNEVEDVINMECTNEVYCSLCDNLWITSLDENFRKSVFEIMRDLFLACYKHKKYQYVQVQWWTTVLQLMLDNNSEVRHEAFLLIDYVPVYGTMTNNSSSVNLLFFKFHECNVQNKTPQFTCVVLFYWSMALLDDTDYEMDDTDVFNKCTNYDFFEPVETSGMCAKFLIQNAGHCMDDILSDDMIDWINTALNIELQKCISFKTLAKNYERYVPALENRLHNILNPTYKNKLLQILAYEPYKNIL